MLCARGRGEAVPGDKPRELYIKLHVTNNTRYTKDGINLLTTVSIPLTETVLGGKETIETLDNAEITVKIPSVSRTEKSSGLLNAACRTNKATAAICL